MQELFSVDQKNRRKEEVDCEDTNALTCLLLRNIVAISQFLNYKEK